MDGYFSKYLRQLILAVIVPVAALIRVAFADPLSGLTIPITLPLIPLFGSARSSGWPPEPTPAAVGGSGPAPAV